MAIINSVIAGGGTTPTGTKYITSNGTHDVAGYANADVQVPTTAPSLFRSFKTDAAGQLVVDNTVSSVCDFSSVKKIADTFCYKMYSNCTNITGAISLANIEDISGSNSCVRMFDGCTGITSVDLSTLQAANGFGPSACQYMFSGCTGIQSINIERLLKIAGTTPVNSMFSGCTGLTSVIFSSLYSIFNAPSVFDWCSNLTSIYFPALTTSGFANGMMNFIGNVNGCTLHFPKNLDPQTGSTVVSGWSAYPDFGGTNTVILFDLPSTFTLTGGDSKSYIRNPIYDTATALAWKVGYTNYTPVYYTSTTADPSVGDTVYSDSACTTAVTTISAIA